MIINSSYRFSTFFNEMPSGNLKRVVSRFLQKEDGDVDGPRIDQEDCPKSKHEGTSQSPQR